MYIEGTVTDLSSERFYMAVIKPKSNGSETIII